MQNEKPIHHHLAHLAKAVRFSPAEVRRDMAAVRGLNAKIAVLVTGAVGTMACAWCFCLIALVSLPAILIQAGALGPSDAPKFLTQPGLILIVAWIAQTFIQLVLLSIIMVGQNVSSVVADARAAHTFDDVEIVLDRLDEKTAGGIETLGRSLVELHEKVDALHTRP